MRHQHHHINHHKKTYQNLLMSLLLSLVITTTTQAQNSDTKRADKRFARLEFVSAAKAYEKLVEKGKGDAYVYKQLADSYYNIFDPIKAEQWYAKTLEVTDTPEAETIYRYAEMLKANGKYEASNTQMDKFTSMNPSDVRAMKYMEHPDYLPKILERGKKFNIQNMSFNSNQSDFGGTIEGKTLYFSSARNSERRTYGWNEEPFLDIYAATQNEDGTYQSAVMLDDKINTQYHEDVVSFTPDGQTMYFSRESFFDKDYQKDSITNNRYSQLYLYKATKTSSGTWGNVEGLNINNPNYSVKNPSVSADGGMLYFASNMAGGYGNFDIYRASINEDGNLGTPENLGQKINTESQEMFPYISSTNTLYFSSNGHLGLGGMDVFYTKLVDGRVGPVRNVGVPINSNADDFAFSIDEATEDGFVSSNRAGGQGSDDIYQIKKIQPLCDVLVNVTVLDSKTQSPLQAEVTLTDVQNNSVNTKTTTADGTTEYIISCDDSAGLSVTKEGYESKKEQMTPTDEEETQITIYLDPIEEIIVEDKVILNPIYFDFDKSNITEQAAFELDKLVQVMNKYPDMVINATSHTDNRGSDRYNQGLSDRRAKTTAQYVISKGIDASRITATGMGENTPSVDCKTNCTEEEHQQNRRSEFVIVSGGPGS